MPVLRNHNTQPRILYQRHQYGYQRKKSDRVCLSVVFARPYQYKLLSEHNKSRNNKGYQDILDSSYPDKNIRQFFFRTVCKHHIGDTRRQDAADCRRNRRYDCIERCAYIIYGNRGGTNHRANNELIRGPVKHIDNHAQEDEGGKGHQLFHDAERHIFKFRPDFEYL